MKALRILLIIIFISFLTSKKYFLAQSIPKSLLDHGLYNLSFDIGENWDKNSIFGNEISFETIKSYSNIINLNIRGKHISSSGLIYLRLKNKYFSYAEYSFTNNHFQPLIEFKNTKIKNEDLIYQSRIDESGFGFKNDWLMLQIKKGMENWGAGNDIELGLSNNSLPYDYFLLSSNYGKINVRYFHGYLESLEDNINRFITGRGLGWSNNKNIIIGMSETVIYSGEDRALDFGYLNPMSSHLEIELNSRLQRIGNKSANAVWQFHSDFFMKNIFRLSLNILIDEFVLDPDIEIGKEHGRAFSSRLSRKIINRENKAIVMYLKYIYVGTPTFRHQFGTNNFVNKNYPIGWYGGSDAEDYSIGLCISDKENYFWEINSGAQLTGEENIHNNPYARYKDYLKGNFPSGEIEKNMYVFSSFKIKIKNNFNLSILNNWSQIRSLNSYIKLSFLISN